MPPIAISAPTQAVQDDFWDLLRLAVNVPCLISGVFCADRKILLDVIGSQDPGQDPGTAPEMIRHLSARMSALTAIRARFLDDKAAPRSDAVVRFPVWLLMNTVGIGVDQSTGALYPVGAHGDQPPSRGSSLQDLLGLGLVHIEYQLASNIHSQSTWPAGLAESTLRLLSIGLFVLDARVTIIHDQSGEDRTKDAVWITARSRLAVKSEAEQQALQAAITDATSDKRLGSIISVTSVGGAMQMVAVAPPAAGRRGVGAGFVRPAPDRSPRASRTFL